MYCSNCGKQIADDATFCQHCGQKVADEIKDNEENSYRCNSCHREKIPILDFDDNFLRDFCPECSEELKQKKCPICKKELMFNPCRCSYCGASWYSERTKQTPRLKESTTKCPKCRSAQVVSNKKGFSIGKALVGNFVAPGVGVLAGLHGSGKIKLTCLKCGHQWNL